MPAAPLVIAILALVVALVALGRIRAQTKRIEEEAAEARRHVRNTVDRLEASFKDQRKLLARLAAGERLDREQILEGRLWGELDDTGGQALLASGGVTPLDVRTPGEMAGGVIPGAVRIPLDELEARVGELPSGSLLVYCAMGARSAAACEFLSAGGREGVFNLEPGIQGWSGPTERPA